MRDRGRRHRRRESTTSAACKKLFTPSVCVCVPRDREYTCLDRKQGVGVCVRSGKYIFVDGVESQSLTRKK